MDSYRNVGPSNLIRNQLVANCCCPERYLPNELRWVDLQWSFPYAKPQSVLVKRGVFGIMVCPSLLSNNYNEQLDLRASKIALFVKASSSATSALEKEC